MCIIRPFSLKVYKLLINCNINCSQTFVYVIHACTEKCIIFSVINYSTSSFIFSDGPLRYFVVIGVVVALLKNLVMFFWYLTFKVVFLLGYITLWKWSPWILWYRRVEYVNASVLVIRVLAIIQIWNKITNVWLDHHATRLRRYHWADFTNEKCNIFISTSLSFLSTVHFTTMSHFK